MISFPGSYSAYNLQEHGFEEINKYMKAWFTMQDESQRVPYSQGEVDEEHDRAVEVNKRDELDAVLEEDDLWWQEEAEEEDDSDTSPPASQQMYDARTDLARHYEKKLDDSLLALVKAVVGDEKKASTSFWTEQNREWSSWLEISCLLPILAATPLTIL